LSCHRLTPDGHVPLQRLCASLTAEGNKVMESCSIPQLL
jgi:hypothetical protein